MADPIVDASSGERVDIAGPNDLVKYIQRLVESSKVEPTKIYNNKEGYKKFISFELPDSVDPDVQRHQILYSEKGLPRGLTEVALERKTMEGNKILQQGVRLTYSEVLGFRKANFSYGWDDLVGQNTMYADSNTRPHTARSRVTSLQDGVRVAQEILSALFVKK